MISRSQPYEDLQEEYSRQREQPAVRLYSGSKSDT